MLSVIRDVENGIFICSESIIDQLLRSYFDGTYYLKCLSSLIEELYY